MGFSAFVQNDDDRIASMGAMNPVEQLSPDGMFSGTGRALAQGVVGGLADVGRMGLDFLDTVNKSQELQYDDTRTPQQILADKTPVAPALDEQLDRVQQWAKIDPRVAGTGAQVVGSLAHGMTVYGLGSLAGGPVAGAGLLGSTTGYSEYRDKVAAGVDPTTAAESAFGAGAFAAAGAFLPMKFGGQGIGGLVKSALGGAAINTGFGVAQRFLSSEILDANGYHDMAKQYQPLDVQSMVADGIMGLAFGGFAHAAHGSDIPAAERPTEPDIEQALDARRNEMTERGAAGIPIDPTTAALHARLNDEALGNMLRAQPADVGADDAHAIVNGSVADPERTQLNDGYQTAGGHVFGDMADFSEPARVETAPQPYAVNDAGEPITTPEGAAPQIGGEDSTAISPTARETMNQLALRNPDLEVDLPNGRTVRAADLPGELHNDMAQANTDAKLHDVAVSCFLRTL